MFIFTAHNYEKTEPDLFTVFFQDNGNKMRYGVVEDTTVVEQFFKSRVEVPNDIVILVDFGGFPKESSENSSDETEAVPQEFKNALIKGQRYAEKQHMSKRRVYKQLISEYGEDFSSEAADYAIDRIEVNWNQNALYKAKNYSDKQNMSKDRIYEQLTSEYGEEFTDEQAQFAIDNLD